MFYTPFTPSDKQYSKKQIEKKCMSSNHQTFFGGGTNHNSPACDLRKPCPAWAEMVGRPSWNIFRKGKKHGMITCFGLIMSIVNSYNKLLSIVNDWTIIIVND